MAARILRQKLVEKGISTIDVDSRRADVEYSSFPSSGLKMSQGSAVVISQIFGDAEYARQHRSRSFTSELLDAVDLVVVMDHQQREKLLSEVEAFSADKVAKVYTFGQMIGEPEYSVADPFGTDLILIEKEYRRRAADNSKELKLSREKAKQYLSDEEIEGFAYQAYLPLYRALDQMCDLLLSPDAVIPSRTMIDVLREDLGYRYERWGKTREKAWPTLFPLRKGKFATFLTGLLNSESQFVENEDAPGLFQKGDFVGAFRHTTTEQSEVMLNLQTFDRQCSRVSNLSADQLPREFTAAAKAYQEVLRRRVMPGFFNGRYLNRYFHFDAAKIGPDLTSALSSLATSIYPAMEELDREGAFRVRRFAASLLDVVENVYSESSVEEVYHEFI